MKPMPFVIISDEELVASGSSPQRAAKDLEAVVDNDGLQDLPCYLYQLVCRVQIDTTAKAYIPVDYRNLKPISKGDRLIVVRPPFDKPKK